MDKIINKFNIIIYSLFGYASIPFLLFNTLLNFLNTSFTFTLIFIWFFLGYKNYFLVLFSFFLYHLLELRNTYLFGYILYKIKKICKQNENFNKIYDFIKNANYYLDKMISFVKFYIARLIKNVYTYSYKLLKYYNCEKSISNINKFNSQYNNFYNLKDMLFFVDFVFPQYKQFMVNIKNNETSNKTTSYEELDKVVDNVSMEVYKKYKGKDNIIDQYMNTYNKLFNDNSQFNEQLNKLAISLIEENKCDKKVNNLESKLDNYASDSDTEIVNEKECSHSQEHVSESNISNKNNDLHNEKSNNEESNNEESNNEELNTEESNTEELNTKESNNEESNNEESNNEESNNEESNIEESNNEESNTEKSKIKKKNINKSNNEEEFKIEESNYEESFFNSPLFDSPLKQLNNKESKNNKHLQEHVRKSNNEKLDINNEKYINIINRNKNIYNDDLVCRDKNMYNDELVCRDKNMYNDDLVRRDKNMYNDDLVDKK